MKTSTIRKNHKLIKYQKLTLAALITGFLSAFLGLALKKLTEHYEEIFFAKTQSSWIFIIIFPFVALSVIYVLRKFLFKGKENKGIKEIFESTNSKKKNLPLYKIPSHFINGFLTVIFGGSTGIEVSTVVATAAIGSVAQQKGNFYRQYKIELICAGVAAGITVLFSSPIAGLLFAYEVISKKVTKAFVIAGVLAVSIAMGLLLILEEPTLFALDIENWHTTAIPYFIALGIFVALLSIYLTRCVFYFKKKFSTFNHHFHRIIAGSIILSATLLAFPELYGDGYHALHEFFTNAPTTKMSATLIISLLSLIVLKPIITSITLASGGDGGVFAPSLFIGAIAGLLLAIVSNHFLNANVLPINFMIIGMAAMLSASIHAPFTALFLICSLTNDYTLFFPILGVCLIAKYTAKAIHPKTVYTWKPSPSKIEL